jgi:hypothetical protein
MNRHGPVLPPVTFLKPEIDSTGGTNVAGVLKGALIKRGEADSESDSDEDVEGDDTHKLRKIAHAYHDAQPVTIAKAVLANDCGAPSQFPANIALARSIEGLGNSREEVALSRIADALAWCHALEMSDDPDFLRPGRRVVIYQEFLDKLGSILEDGDVSKDKVASRIPAYEAILLRSMTWAVTSRPIMLPAGDSRLSVRIPANNDVYDWMLGARRIAVSGYR